MKYPLLTELNTSRQMIDVFGGYNHNLRIPEGEFYDMTNLTSDNYPALSPRPKRGTVLSHPKDKIYGMISKGDKLCYVAGNSKDGVKFYLGKTSNIIPVEGLSLSEQETADGGKTLVSMGAYVIIVPDNVWVNTQQRDDGGYDWGYIDAQAKITSGTVTFTMCDLDGNAYTNSGGKAIPIQPSAPTNPTNLDYWIDTASTPRTLRQYSETTGQWTAIATTYIKMQFSYVPQPLNELFADEDGITISGIRMQILQDLNNTMTAWKVGSDYIIVSGIVFNVWEIQPNNDTPMILSRKMPVMDYVIESENRLWGCRYGENANGDMVNEIYASKLGDFKNWNAFAGISTDSYAVSLGTDGRFTGAITHLGYPLFFKENCMHKIYGNYPANYQLQTTACRGVQRGSARSLAIVNETLYYKSTTAICAYDGSLPVEISANLGKTRLGDATAGVLGNKYYISVYDEDANANYDVYRMFVYDTARGMWHKEEDTHSLGFCNHQGNLYYIDYDHNEIRSVHGVEGLYEHVVKWQAITGIIGVDSPDKKYISRLVLRLLMEAGSRVTLYIEYDSCGAWEQLFTTSGTSMRSFSLPIRPKRCDHLRLRIDGAGEAKILSICKTLEQGSDV